jgi:CubicO group peptidase (beta-lactamase class C family)
MEKHPMTAEARPHRQITRVEAVLGVLVLFLLTKLYAPSIASDHVSDRENESEYFTCHAPPPSLLTTHRVDRAAFEADIQWTESTLKQVVAGTNGYGAPADAISISVFLPNGAPIYEAGFGKRRANESGASTVDGDSIFRMASITKMFTAAQLMLQKQQGLLSFEEDVSDILHDFKPTTEGWTTTSETQVITTRQLLSHMSGLIRDEIFEAPWPIPREGNRSAPNKFPSRAAFMEAVHKTPAVMASYQTPVYSNIAFDVAGWVSEKIAHTPYPDLLARDIFEPLGLSSSRFNLSIETIDRIVVPETKYAGWADLDMEDGSPAGGLYSSAADLRRFGQELLDPQHSSKFLTKQTIREWLKPLHVFDDNLLSVGLSWEIYTVSVDGRRMSLYTKSGSLPGFHTLFGVDPEREFGFTLLISGQETDNSTALAIRIAKRFARTVGLEREKILAQEYAGTYRAGEDTVAELKVSDGGLALTRLVLNGTDVFEALHWGEGDNGEVALWPTHEPRAFRLALGRPPVEPYGACLYKMASIDPLYSNGYPVDLLVLDGQKMVYGSANLTLTKAQRKE